MSKSPAEKFNQYKSSSAFKELVKKHSLSQYGVWNVYGEDPNPDFGGHHHEPFLGQFEGGLEDVIYHATTELSGFWQWGAGGRISPVLTQEIRVIGSHTEAIKAAEKISFEKTRKADDLRRKIERLEDELRNL